METPEPTKPAGEPREQGVTGEAGQTDVAAVLSDLREKIRERRASLAINSPGDPHASGLAEMRRTVESVNELWFVSAHLPVTWDTPIVGRLLAYTKRVVRILLRWYINPIVEQQNRYNSATARAITVMNAYQERVTRDYLLLEERVAKIEELVGSGPATGDGLPAPESANHSS